MIGFNAFAVICALALTANVDVSGNDITENIDDFVQSDENNSDIVSDQGHPAEDVLSILTNIYNSVSGNSLQHTDDMQDDVQDVIPYSDYQGSYGSLSSDMYNYFSGFLCKLSFSDHYVCSRYFLNNNSNNYLFAWGDLDYSNGIFIGNDINVVTVSGSSTGTNYRYELQSSFRFNPANNYVYTDLTIKYPALSSPSDFSLRQICYFFGFVIVFYTVTKFVVFPRRKGRVKL